MASLAMSLRQWRGDQLQRTFAGGPWERMIAARLRLDCARFQGRRILKQLGEGRIRPPVASG